MADRNQEQLELITEELEDLDRQVAVGDLDAATARHLRAKYVAELDTLIADRGQRSEPTSQKVAEKQGRVPGRAIVGTAVVSIAIAVIAVFAVNSLSGPSTAGVEGVASDVVSGDVKTDLSEVSNEEMETIVAQNPDVVGMRLALARRYFEAGDFTNALDHYMVVLDQEQHPEALANVGWMTYMSGRSDLALGYVEAALVRQPDFVTATWFLGNIQFTLGNYEAATIALTKIVETDGVPDDVKQSARALLLQMEEG
jgi:cytochrome c-type biogenesis protein CcmH/NrfG